MTIMCIFMCHNKPTSKPSDLALANIEALSEDEIEVVGCKRMDGATCYVFSDGNLIDKQKNQYPGN